MSLWTRLGRPLDGEEKIPVHAFFALCGWFKESILNAVQVKNRAGVADGDETTQLNTLLTRIDTGAINAGQVERAFMLWEQGWANESEVKASLGVT